jgi:hypothetical protein|tara:strand:- start:502 stop:1026 length:525 start_codon:yes stop_codon:yes gene_type:complete
MAKKVTHKFKTKRRDGKRYMICRNSIVDQKHWSFQFLGDKPRCNRWSEVGEGSTAVLCYKCVCQTVGPPEIKGGYVSKGRPRGWQFMKEFVDPQGNVFHKGKEQPKLKGTLEPTKIDRTPKKKLSKQEKEDLKDKILQQMIMVRGDLKKAKWKKDIKSSTSQLKKLERELKKIR